MRYLTNENIAQAVACLRRHRAGEYAAVLAELSAVWGRPLDVSTLSHAFKLRGMPAPRTLRSVLTRSA